jgi:penicillin-binding protein 2
LNYSRNNNKTKNVILIIYILIIFLITCQYFNLQIINYEKYHLKAGYNSLKKIILKAPRGIIYDRNKKPIVDNQYIYNVNIMSRYFDSNSFNYNLLKNEIDIDKITIDSIVSNNKYFGNQYKSKLIKKNINFKKKSILEESKLDIPGINFSHNPIRSYTSNSNLSHVLGYLRTIDNSKGQGSEGFSGIEKFYEIDLKGSNGIEYRIVDKFGIDQGLFIDGNIYDAKQGSDLFLTIDSDLQSYSEQIMGEKIGSIIVMDPQTGEVLTMLSTPSYELDSFAGGISLKKWNEINNNKKGPFTNRAIQSSYPPGSIFKLILAAIVLEEEIISKDWKVNCTGEYQFYDQLFRCWKEEGHDTVDLNKAIQQSCNVYFYNLIQQIDFDLWSKEAIKFGFGKKSGIDLPNEKQGLVPDRKFMTKHHKNKGGWSAGHLLNLSIGQGETMVTPIQIVNLMNIIANEGYYLIPHLNLKTTNTEKIDLKYRNSVWRLVKKAMFDAVNKSGGTAYNAYLDNNDVKIYGKTGTAQICSNCDVLPHAWFAGFIEANNSKKYSITIIIENGGKGSNIPAILAKKIFKFILEKNV